MYIVVNVCKCCITRDLGHVFVEEHKDKGYTQFQLHFFYEASTQVSHIFFIKIARKSFEKEVDKFFENEDLIRRFGGAKEIKPYKAFVKRCSDLLEMIDLQR